MNDATVVLEARGLTRMFDDGSLRVEVLKGVDLRIVRGERIAIVGASGSGKSTLLHCLGGLDRPNAGSVQVGGQDLLKLREAARGRVRNRALGFVYQFHHLLPEFTALENVAMPLLIRGEEVTSARDRAAQTLERVGLGQRIGHKPSQLSGGERQRAAIARALVTEPACVLADEPTGNLDRATGAQILTLLQSLTHQAGKTLILVTHSISSAQQAEHIYRLEGGVLVDI